MSKFREMEIDLLKNSLRRMEADSASFSVGEGAFTAAENASNANVEEAVLEDGEILIVPEAAELDKYVFEHRFNGNKAYGVLCISSLGMVKKLYTTTLKKRVIEYDPATKLPAKNADGTRKTPHWSESEVSKRVRECATIREIFDYIAGHKIQFKKLGVYITSRIENRVVVGTRITTLFEPHFVD